MDINVDDFFCRIAGSISYSHQSYQKHDDHLSKVRCVCVCVVLYYKIVHQQYINIKSTKQKGFAS